MGDVKRSRRAQPSLPGRVNELRVRLTKAAFRHTLKHHVHSYRTQPLPEGGGIMKDLEEVVRLFKAALDTLTMGKDRVTSKAYYTRAQTLLDEIEKNMGSAAGATVRKARPVIRAYLLHEKSLQKRFEATLAFWSQAVANEMD